MKLPELPFLNKKQKEEFFICLILKPKNIVAILLNNKDSKLSIISTKSVSLDLESSSTEDMISAGDEAISSIELSLDEDEKIEKTIFSVPYSWSDSDGGIKKERLSQLKKLSVELALKPMGFIVNIEALIKYFQDKEGVPLSAIFVEETKDKVYLYLVKGGNIKEVQSGEITEEVEKDVEHILKKVENFKELPTRMILLYHADIESRQQNFLNYPWTKDQLFMHLPQISLMEKGFENEAVVDAIASQMDANLSDKVEVAGAEVIDSKASNIAADSESFGFMKERDAAFLQEELEEEKSEEIKVNGISEDDDKFEKDDDNPNNKAGIIAIVFAAILGLFSKVFGFTKEGVSLPSKLRRLFIPIAVVLIFMTFMAVYFFVFLRAEVVVFLQGEITKDEVVVNLSEEDDTSYNDKILRIDAIEQEVTGKVSQNTTGIEEIGESAKGEVTILSSLGQNSTIDADTVITSSNGLNFTLDSDVSIASSSGVSDIKSVKAKVTAEEIGKEYNLPSGTKFSVEGYSSTSVEAKNDVAFAGGTKEEKKIVSNADIQALEKKLLEELFENAITAAKAKVGDDEEIISVLLDSSIEDESYSAETGDEAATLELEAAVKYTLGVYKKEEAKKFINDARGGKAPKGFIISDEDSQISLNEIDQSGKRITGKLVYEVLYRPDIDLTNLAKEVSGKSSTSAAEYIKGLEGVSDAAIIFKNKLPLLPPILPVSEDHIEVKLQFEN